MHNVFPIIIIKAKRFDHWPFEFIYSSLDVANLVIWQCLNPLQPGVSKFVKTEGSIACGWLPISLVD
jgi:hypothetical protein